MTNAFVGPLGETVQLPKPASRPSGRADRLHQPLERDSGGGLYIYTKSRLRTVSHALVLRHLDEATLAAVLDFFRTATRGTKDRFTWHDHLGAARTLRLASPRLAPQPAGPGRHHLNLDLEEELPL